MQTELHRHLDVSTRLSTLLELAQAKGFEPQSTSLNSFREKFIMHTPMTDLSTVIRQFIFFAKVLDRPEVLERVAFECVEDCRSEGTRQVELRFSPSFVTSESGLSWEVALDAFSRGVQRALVQYPDMKAGLICIASREFGYDAVARTVEFYVKHMTRFIGVDLAGDEKISCRDLAGVFKGLKEKGARITIHSGESTGPEHIWEAIEFLGAERIGHGISSVRDAKLLELLRDRKICLEMCPTSNWLTRSVERIEDHPLPQVLRAGVPVCINTDDPGMFGVTLPEEIEICRTRMGLSSAEIADCERHAMAASFLK